MKTKKKQSIGVIGAGFTGLSVGWELVKDGYEVSIFEEGKEAGGLAIGFENRGWKWSLEKHYHHLFLTDKYIRRLASEVNHKILIKRPKTSTLIGGKISQIDSALKLLAFHHLSLFSRVRTGFILLVLKTIPFLKQLERVSTEKFLRRTMGDESWKVLWGPLMTKKFGGYSKLIPASWFWARVKTRTAKLAYPSKGFLELAKTIVKKIEKKGGKFFFGSRVLEVKKIKDKFKVTDSHGRVFLFDKIICTLPTHIFTNVTKGLPKSYLKKIKSLKGLGAINLVLALDRSLLTDGTYWLNVNEKDFPFLCIVEHTNFMSKKNYKGNTIVYVGNYLERNHKYFEMTSSQLLNEYIEHIKRVIPEFKKNWIKKSWAFKAPFAQPIITRNYSKTILPLKTPIDGLYLANIQQVYPWDRGTNYAVGLGVEVFKLLKKDI